MKPIRTISLIACSVIALWAHPAGAQGGGGGGGGGDGQGGPDGPPRWGARQGPGFHGGMAGHQMRERMRRHGMRGARMRDPVARLLDHQTLLRLTPAQVNSLISIDDKLHNDNTPLIQRLMAMRRELQAGNGRSRGGNAGGVAPATGQRDSAMAIVRTIRENGWRATSAADAVLTAEQLATAATLDPASRRGRGGAPGSRMDMGRRESTAPNR
jgi:hypothetical protein